MQFRTSIVLALVGCTGGIPVTQASSTKVGSPVAALRDDPTAVAVTMRQGIYRFGESPEVFQITVRGSGQILCEVCELYPTDGDCLPAGLRPAGTPLSKEACDAEEKKMRNQKPRAKGDRRPQEYDYRIIRQCKRQAEIEAAAATPFRPLHTEAESRCWKMRPGAEVHRVTDAEVLALMKLVELTAIQRMHPMLVHTMDPGPYQTNHTRVMVHDSTVSVTHTQPTFGVATACEQAGLGVLEEKMLRLFKSAKSVK